MTYASINTGRYRKLTDLEKWRLCNFCLCCKDNSEVVGRLAKMQANARRRAIECDTKRRHQVEGIRRTPEEEDIGPCCCYMPASQGGDCCVCGVQFGLLSFLRSPLARNAKYINVPQEAPAASGVLPFRWVGYGAAGLSHAHAIGCCPIAIGWLPRCAYLSAQRLL